ncbi:Cyclin, N-terminal domain-containing protein [Tribonema minus]|uniref:Cyclin, N-terminal domain-containing protein n=1 Tax=Tribonema minus TaxID=303371 RepID=A0A836CA68_9STRA|nr:Cyclin, N-terminal domain-containing protein [Tribonema minus]
MYSRYVDLEAMYAPTVYMHMQEDINEKMRSILIDWIVEVHFKFKLATPTLYLTCNIIDRYCMVEAVTRDKLQLVGVTALLVACKYEEIWPPEVRDCVYITDNTYTREQMLEMEMAMVRRLRYQLTVPTAWTFLARVLRVARATETQFQRACYYSERMLQEHDMLAFRPSLVAATATYLSRLVDIEDAHAWPPVLEEFCGLSVDMLMPCAHMMRSFLEAEPVTANHRHLVAAKRKFLQDKFLSVSIEELPQLPSPPATGAFS